MRFFAFCLALLSTPLYAEESLSFEATSGNELEYIQFAEDDDAQNLIIYLPGQRGLGNEYVKWANDLAFNDTHVWAVDLHASYLLAKTRSSPIQFVVSDVVELVAHAQQDYDNIYLLSVSRGAKFVLDVAYQHQLQYKTHHLKGIILHAPHLVKGSVEIGESATYQQIAQYSNLPLFLIFSEYSTKYARAGEIKNTLSIGGSQVFTMLLPDTIAGFFMRKNTDLNSTSIINKNKLSQTYQNALMLFDTLNIPPIKQMKTIDTDKARVQFSDTLSVQNTPSKELILEDLEGNTVNLQSYKGKVVLLNFWASWCTPCIKEIPSLMRLKEKVNHPDFEILAINIGESRERIVKFKKKVPFELTTLLDTEGKYANAWHVYAYPSNYITDKTLQVRYGYRGALEWDREDIVTTITALLNEH